MRRKQKPILIHLMVFLMLFQTLMFFPQEVFAYPDNEEEFKEYLQLLEMPYTLPDGKQANWNTYQTYNQIIWGEPEGDTKYKSLCGNSSERRYLGYNQQGDLVTNSCFPPDSTSGRHPKEFNYINISDAMEKWSRIQDPSIKEHIKNSGWTGNGADEDDPMYYSYISSEAKARVDIAPTWRGEGSVYTQHQASSGKIWYATFVVPSLVDNSQALVDGTMTTDKETYIISASEVSATANVTLEAEALLSGLMQYNHITELSATFQGNKATTSGQRYATLSDQQVSFSRDQYAPGTHSVTLEGMVQIHSKFGDTEPKKVSKTISLIVEEPSTPTMITTASASPSVTIIGPDQTAKDVTVSVTVNGEIMGLGDPSQITSYQLIAREEQGNDQLQTKEYSGVAAQNFEQSSTFSFVIPKERFETDAYIQEYVVRARAFLDDGTVVTSTSITKAEVYPPGIEPEFDPSVIPNMPPVAMLYADPDYYWVETFTFQDQSVDGDGMIVSRDFRVDGMPSSLTYSSSRVTSPKVIYASLEVTDDDGDSDHTTRSVTILPTIPTAGMNISGDLKINRKIILDATASDYYSPTHVAPIDYSRSQWTVRPLTAGIDPSGIKIRSSSDLSNRELLVREPGEYEATLSVTNIYNETSDIVTKTFVVEDDLPPEAKFTVDKKVALRDENTGNAIFTLRDQSITPDGDTIKKRIWYVRHDSNNDGFINDQDGPRQILSEGNEKLVTFETDKVGNYHFSLEVVEDFGQPTLEEFILDEHYLKDQSNILNSDGNASIYMQDANFNIPETDKVVEVDNAPPIIDFGATRHNKVDIVLNFGGLDIATQEHLTGSAPGGGTYDHYYYSFDTTAKNKLTSLAGGLETSLKQKGIDANVTIDNSYYHQEDTDGVGIRNIPVYGWVDYGSYQYSSYSGTSPYSGSWEVTSQSSTDVYVVVWCYYRYWWVDPDYPELRDDDRSDWVEHSHSPPCTNSSNEITEYSHTNYSASLRRWVSDWRYVVVGYENQGLASTEQVDTTDFSEAFVNQTYRDDANNYYIRFDNEAWTWKNNTSKWNSVTTKANNDNVFTWNRAIPENRLNAELLAIQGSGWGKYEPYDADYLIRNLRDIEDYFINQYMIEENAENLTIVLGDRVDYTTAYSDFENDPEIRREWKFTHDQFKVNGREIDDPTAKIPQSGLWLDSPVALTQPGTYTVQLRAMDDPVYWGDDRFFDYRKWSDHNVQREYKINVHRRPIADFGFNIDVADNYRLDVDPTLSYDPDHKDNRSDRGIVEHTWLSYSVDDIEYDGAPPEHLEVGKNYDVTLQVKDVDGAYATITKRISTMNLNIKPVALFDVQGIVEVGETLDFVDRSYDPNGDPLTNYEITVRRQGQTSILKTLSSWPTSFSSMNLPEGKYVIGLTVQDIPNTPPSLRSDIYEENIEVIGNSAPVSDFSLSPTPIEVDKLATYTDSSYDPDGHNLVNYSWKVELLDVSGSFPIRTWQVGYPPIDFTLFSGVGKYRITQTVFDDPPYPLTSSSGSKTITVDVVQGPKEPYAEFIWTPEFPISENTITLDPTPSYDVDGNITAWEWEITSPSGVVTNSTSKNPIINNAVEGIYQVQLHVYDNNGLRSLVPALHEITVNPKPPNSLPIAEFVWFELMPTLGENIELNPDGSYDLDGNIVSWDWEITSKEGTTTTSNEKYPVFQARSEWYDVTLTVTDDQGGVGVISKRIVVSIAGIEALVTHTEEWKNRWIDDGFNENTNKFRAGEKFVIHLTTKPAQRVWGKINFGGSVGVIQIPHSMFTMQTYDDDKMEMHWTAKLWKEDFPYIEEGEYVFTFQASHPEVNPMTTSTTHYRVEIIRNIYERMKFHRSF
ncbi:hypothetical protein BKP35_16555 [Anaerobacillus arseniciselenatis]|uniref:PKD/Chitinase domain-containing protein n=1 Tax=Anaerobacillus arseniciselenatis TaxID=85682 RepID=A0A1S2LD73_9BACI|nr:PKD domain-containing protein [Anaerobacillus arseniciselenatis]OIJ09465.1 hypothetical protein BKP35_16555 [Anaerobacillus arseniciselenatis]